MEVEVQAGPSSGEKRWRSRALGRLWTVCFFFFCFLCLAVWGEGDRGALLGSSRSIWDRIWLFVKATAAAMALRAACSGISNTR